MATFVKTGVIASLLLCLFACTSTPQTAQLKTKSDLPVKQYEIKQVPFIAQQEYFCGPTTLTEVVQFYGKEQTPDNIAPSLFIPEKLGSLQIEMVAAARQNNLLAYSDRGSLKQLLSLILDDIPVIVLQNNGVSWYPRWHYAVVIGFDLTKQQVILHSGITQRYHMDMSLFETTWQRGDYWFLAAVPDHKISEHFIPLKYVNSAQDLIDVNQTDTGVKALETATAMWPEYWLSYFLLGNYYITMDLNKAVHWYQMGLDAGNNNAVYLNNYAYALNELGCIDSAINIIKKANKLSPDNPEIVATYQDILNDNVDTLKVGKTCALN